MHTYFSPLKYSERLYIVFPKIYLLSSRVSENDKDERRRRKVVGNQTYPTYSKDFLFLKNFVVLNNLMSF